MTEATWYSEGAFCWADCQSSDLEATKSFYTRVFGWEVVSTELPTGGEFVLFRLDGKNVAGAYGFADEPSRWNTYINCDDVDRVVQKAEGLGASVFVAPMDVSGSGRVAFINDPTGARIGLWQAKGNIGAELYAIPNTLTWFELMTGDPARAAEFYRGLFGYGVLEMPTPTGDYRVLRHKEENAGGIMVAPDANMPAVWTPYLEVEDAEKTLEVAKAAGASEMMPITKAEGVGWFTWVTDPAGATIAIIQAVPEDERLTFE